MSITVTTPAEQTSLTTVAAVKAALGVASSKFDAELTRLIAAATSAIETYVGHVYAQQTYEEGVVGSDHPMLMVTNVPVVGTPVVLSGGSPVTDFEVRDAAAGVLYRQVGWAAGDWVGWETEPVAQHSTGELTYYVTYVAGYVLPGQPDADLPGHIEQACIETVVAWYRGAKRDPSVASKKVGDLTITYQDTEVPTAAALGLPPMARALLSRRVR